MIWKGKIILLRLFELQKVWIQENILLQIIEFISEWVYNYIQ